MTEAKLRECPLCGKDASPNGHSFRAGTPDLTWSSDGTPITDSYYCNCMFCGCNNAGITGGYRTREKAIAAWNTRPLETEMYEALKAVYAGTMNGDGKGRITLNISLDALRLMENALTRACPPAPASAE